ncbi:MAG: AraC family transcriptional regulator [Burkholderiales bacterium]|nr:AraC family transcriptional regulator [Burkholderiales bacterium]
MTREPFEAGLRADGFQEIVERSLEPDYALGLHTHAWEVRALVEAGDLTLIVDGVPTTYRAGEVFALAPDIAHEEFAGAQGAALYVGRRHRMWPPG